MSEIALQILSSPSLAWPMAYLIIFLPKLYVSGETFFIRLGIPKDSKYVENCIDWLLQS